MRVRVASVVRTYFPQVVTMVADDGAEHTRIPAPPAGPPPPPPTVGPPPPPPPGSVGAPPPPPVTVGPPPPPVTVGAPAPPVLSVGPPPGPPPGPVPVAAAPPRRRRRRGWLVPLGVVGVLVAGVAVAGYVLVGRYTEPEDLGVRATEADFDSALAKIGVTWPEPPAGADPEDYEREYLGARPMDVVLTESELSALMSFRHAASTWPLSQVQVDVTGLDSARMSAMVHYAGRDWPVLVEGTGGFSGSALWAELDSARVGAVSVPERFLPAASDALEEIVNSRTGRIAGLDVMTLEVTPEGVHVTGTTWETAQYVPRG